jgi:hypothetical protein
MPGGRRVAVIERISRGEVATCLPEDVEVQPDALMETLGDGQRDGDRDGDQDQKDGPAGGSPPSSPPR